MAYYFETVNYFRNLAILHPKIQHSTTAGQQKRFFRMNVEEFVTGSVATLPNDPEKAFMVLINYIKTYDDERPENEVQKIMFYIMSHAGSKDFEKEDAARGFTERICEDIILRMKNDSNNNDTFLRHSYDEIANTRIIPAELKNASGNYVGWQVVISLTRKFNTCYNQSNWGI